MRIPHMNHRQSMLIVSQVPKLNIRNEWLKEIKQWNNLYMYRNVIIQ